MSDNLNDVVEGGGESVESGFKFMEGGYGWLVIAATIVCGCLTNYKGSNYSLVQDRIFVEYNETKDYVINAGI